MSKFVPLGPVILVRRSQDLHNLVELVDLVIAWKKWAKGVKFGHDDAQGKDIDWGVVMGGSKE